MQKPASLLSSQTDSASVSLPSSTGASVPPSAAGAWTGRLNSYTQTYLTAANTSQSNNNPVMRSAASRSAAVPSVYANVPVSSAEPVGTTGRPRMQPTGMRLCIPYCCICNCCICGLVVKVIESYPDETVGGI